MKIGAGTRFVRLLFAGVACAVGVCLPEAAETFREDADVLWSALRDRYAYLDCSEEALSRGEASFRAQIGEVNDRTQFLPVLEQALGSFADAHMNVGAHAPGSPRLVPTGADLWAEWQGGEVVV
jgi:carboxyl-terminal processing protease